MGRPARNHGGTGGHGYLPLPGERPNFHRHLLKDMTLTSLVKSSLKQSKKKKGVEILKPFKNDEKKSTFNKASNSEKELSASAKLKVHVAKDKLSPKEGTKLGLGECPKKIEQSSDVLMQKTFSSQEMSKPEDKVFGQSSIKPNPFLTKPKSPSEEDSEHSQTSGRGHKPRVKLPDFKSVMQRQQDEKQEESGTKTFIVESVDSPSHFTSVPFVNIPLGHFFPANHIFQIPVFPLNFFLQPPAYSQANHIECYFEVPPYKDFDATMTPEKIHSEPEVQQSTYLQCDLDHNMHTRAKPGGLGD